MNLQAPPITEDFVHTFFGHVDQHNFDVVEVMLDPECTITAPGFTQVGASYVCLWMAGFFAAFPDLRHHPRRILIDGRDVAFELTVTGTHTADLSLPDGTVVSPTGRRLELVLAEFWSLEDGLVKDYTVHYDNHDFLVQLGLVT